MQKQIQDLSPLNCFSNVQKLGTFEIFLDIYSLECHPEAIVS